MLLLDTHVLIWLVQATDRLGRRSLAEIDRAAPLEMLAVSAVSYWEAALLDSKGRLRLLPDVDQWRLDTLSLGIVELPLNGEIGMASARLNAMHADPADRFIVATALAHDATLVTADERILGWAGALRRLDARQ